jgi:hypothetical protein
MCRRRRALGRRDQRLETAPQSHPLPLCYIGDRLDRLIFPAIPLAGDHTINFVLNDLTGSRSIQLKPNNRSVPRSLGHLGRCDSRHAEQRRTEFVGGHALSP